MSEQPKLKMVRAKRTGSYDGHRRRAGDVFAVQADKNEIWFEDAGEAPEGAVLPSQIQNVQGPPRKSFTQIMAETGRTDLEMPLKPVAPEPVALSSVPVTPLEDLVG